MNNKQGIIVHVVIAWVVVMAAWSATAQPAGSDVYRYSCVGNCERLNSHAKGAGGLMLAGGGEDVDAAFKWFIGQAGGGDLVVLRTSGGDGYDRYLYELVPGGLNSVSTFVMAGTAAAHDEFLLSKVANATAIFWAGGDQWTYYSYVKQTPLQEALQHAISPPFSSSSPPPPSFTSRYPSRNAVYGGTSAGCAIQGEYIYIAEFNTITSAHALANPYDVRNTIGTGFASSLPLMSNVITDTHYAQRDRAGRSLSWLARMRRDGWTRMPMNIALNEASVLLVRPDGLAFFEGGNAQSAVYLMTLAEPSAIDCEPDSELRVAADVVRMSSNGPLFFDFRSRAVVPGSGFSQYSLYAANEKVTSSTGSVY